jgi:branched-chain amino acid transport system substrate-binding protein
MIHATIPARTQIHRLLTAAVVVTAISMTGCLGAAPAPSPTAEATAAPAATRSADAVASLPSECLADSYGCADIPPGETIKIGMAGPMTGDYQAFGLDISDAARLAVEDFGTYVDWQFELVVGDTQGDPTLGEAVALEWASEPTLVAVAGHIFSGETSRAMPIYAEAGIVMMSPSATNPDLTRVGSPVFNRLAFTDAIQARDAALFMFTELSITRIAALHDDEPYGQALAEVTSSEFQALGGEVVLVGIVPDDDDLLAGFISDLADQGIQAIYYGGYDVAATRVVNTLGRLRAAAAETPSPTAGAGSEPSASYDILFFGCDGTYGTSFLEGTGEYGEGAYAATLYPAGTTERLVFDGRYATAYGFVPGQRSPYTWYGYDAVGVLIYAVKRIAVIGSDGHLYIPRGALIEAVRGIDGYPGLTGLVTCNEVGECATIGPTFYMIRDGNWVPAS